MALDWKTRLQFLCPPTGVDWVAKHIQRFFREGRFQSLGFALKRMCPLDWCIVGLYTLLGLCVTWNTVAQPLAWISLPPPSPAFQGRPPHPGRMMVAPHPPPLQEATGAQIDLGEDSTPPINLNTATAEELELLPGIGPVLAQRIITWRQSKAAAIQSVEELENVSGIGPVLLSKIKERVTVSP